MIQIQHCEKGFYSPKDPLNFFTHKRDAANHHKFIVLKDELSQGSTHDPRNLNELIGIWYRMHGQTLRDHVRLRDLLYRMSEKLGNPIASTFTSEQFGEYREKRILEVSTATANREHAYLRALFNELKRLSVIKYENPLKGIRQFKERDCELRYLTDREVSTLLFACNQSTNRSLIYIVKICLATGARWSEAESLTSRQISPSMLITFLNTKSGKNRSVPICQKLFDDLQNIKASNRKGVSLFEPSMSAFRKAIKDTNIYLPRGQLSHVLRHSFASYFMSKGGNIFILQEILGHSEITTTMRYAHLAPEHLNEAVRLNPLNDHI